MTISIHALMLSIKAMQRDIARHEQLAADATLSDDELDYYGQMVLDQTQVFGELGMAYEKALLEHPDFPALHDLLNPPSH